MKKFTVSEITQAINSFSETVTVSGEITSLSVSPRGHLYFSLKDDKAKIRVAMFKSAAVLNRAYVPKNGDSVEVAGDLKLYETDGAYQLIARKIEYDSVGLFWQKFEEVKRKLEKEGLFDEAKKKPVGELPERIAVITSPTGAAVRDFIITAKNGGGRFTVDIWPVPVQGKEAAAPIVTALKQAGRMTDIYDAVVLMRGGGSLEDLAVFNEEEVARALFATEVPSISAIGHERDFSICDFVADLRVATPTAAASKLCEGYVRREKELAVYVSRLENVISTEVNTLNQRLDSCAKRLGTQSPQMKLQSMRNLLAYYEKGVAERISSKVSAMHRRVEGYAQRVRAHDPRLRIERMRAVTDRAFGFVLRPAALRQKITALAERTARAEKDLYSAFSAKVKTNTQKLDILIARLDSLSPEKPLERGFAMVKLNDRLVKKAIDLHLQDELEIRFKDGYINSFVTGRKLSEDDNGKNPDNKRRVSKEKKRAGETQDN
jgi:exodeoxyribonuclease VII large subunit